MTSAAIVESPRGSMPSWAFSSYEAHDAYASISDSNLYAAGLVRSLADASSEDFHQRKMNVTFGQISAIHPTELGFRLGVPSIRAVWSTSSALPGWIDRVLKLCDLGSLDAALKEVSLATGRLKVKGEFTELSTDLERFDLRSLPDIVLVSLLRNTYSIRSQVSFWNSLLDQTESLLRERKREPRSLLRGLKSYS